MEVELKQNLTKFKIVHTRLLYIIYYLFKINVINYEEKLCLKKLVIMGNENILQIYCEYEKTLNLNNLVSDFKNIYNLEKENHEYIPEDNNEKKADNEKLNTFNSKKQPKDQTNSLIILKSENKNSKKDNGQKIYDSDSNKNNNESDDDDIGQSPTLAIRNLNPKNQIKVKSYLGHAVTSIK